MNRQKFSPGSCSSNVWAVTIVLNFMGGFGGAYIGMLPGCDAVTGFHIRRYFSTVLGAIGVMVVVRLATGRKGM